MTEEDKNKKGYQVKKLREEAGMSRREFCEFFDIPYRTLQDWELGNRSLPDYLLRLMSYRLKIEGFINK